MIGRLIGKLSPTAAPQDPSFDPVFYGTYYADLKTLGGSAALYQHYSSYGRKEGRFPNEAALYDDLQKRYGKLPSGFKARAYRQLHPDLRQNLKNDWQATEHYLIQGRKERREYIPFDAISTAASTSRTR
jgi:hypothetical protein